MKKMKRVLAVLLSLLFLVLAVQTVLAATIAEGSCGPSATWALDATGNLIVKGGGVVSYYSGGNDDFRKYVGKIKAIYIKKNISTINSQTFQRLNELKTISIESSVETISQSAFSSCPSLTKVTLSEGLLTLGSKVFESCSALQEIVLPSSIQSLGVGLFLNCKALKTITVLSKNVAFPTALFSPKTTAIKGYVGSTAETYAKAFGLTFVPMEDTSPTQPTGETTTALSQTTTAAALGGEACPLCGQIHAGFPDSVLGFLHKAIYMIVKLFGL